MDFRAQWLAQGGTVLNLDYRYTRNFVDQAGVSAALPIGKQWRLLGSYQYDVQDQKPLEQLVGIGYDGGCWTAQLMMFHQILLGGQTNDAVYLEIVLRGLTSIGNSSNGFLDQYVPGARMEF
jgi:LPS-assembly protein